jgi:DNA-binding winged helix-turn-helix (wHTH) protein/tetratricopeptide (TPR) repeat protein
VLPVSFRVLPPDPPLVWQARHGERQRPDSEPRGSTDGNHEAAPPDRIAARRRRHGDPVATLRESNQARTSRPQRSQASRKWARLRRVAREDRSTTPRAFTFDEFEVDLDARVLRKGGVQLAARGKPFELLGFLLENRHRIVSKEELLRAVWPGVSVSDDALTSALRDLRRILHDSEAPHRIIVTMRARGYRFAGDVREPATHARSTVEAMFVDRDEVMQQLRASLTAAVAGRLQISLLAGPPGIGKTRTATELVREARSSGVEVHLARCYGGDGATPFWPWIQVARSLLEGKDPGAFGARVGSVIGRLRWIMPELAESGAMEARADLNGLEARFRVFDAMGVLLGEMSKTKALLIFVDDLHWADDSSLLLFKFLAETLPDSRLHLVGGFRDSEVKSNDALARTLGAVAEHPGTQRIDLAGLRRDSVARMLSVAAGREPESAFVDRVCSATGGNPFFVSELASLVTSGQLDITDTGKVPLPGRVRDALRLQVERRSKDCQDVLKLASLVGRDVELPLLSRASSLSQMRTLELLEEAEEAGLVVAAPEKLGQYAFLHDLVREAIYRGLGSTERTRLHRKMAVALESFEGAERLAELAHHYSEAAPDGVADKALIYSERAAKRANELVAYEDSVAYYDLVEDAPPDLRCRLLLDQAEAAWGTLEPAKSVQNRMERAADAARHLGSRELFARAALGRTGHGSGIQDYRDIAVIDPVDIKLLREASDLLGDEPSALKGCVLSRLALAVRYAEDVAIAEELSARAISMAESLGDSQTLAATLRYRHEVLSSPEYAQERLELARRILDLARAARHRTLEIDGLFFVARNKYELGDVLGARETADSAIALTAAMRRPGAEFRSGISRVMRLTLGGRFEEALDCARSLYERDASRNLGADGTLAMQELMIHWFRGAYEEAARIAELRVQRPNVYRFTRYALASTYAALGRTEEARAIFEQAASDSFRHVPRDHALLGSIVVLADLCFEFQDVPRARSLYDLARPFDGMIAAPFIATICLGAASRALGVLAHLLGRYDDAEGHFERALATEEKVFPPLAAHTLTRYARMLLDRRNGSDRERAHELLGKAARIASELGMPEVSRSTAELRSLSSNNDARRTSRHPRLVL